MKKEDQTASPTTSVVAELAQIRLVELATYAHIGMPIMATEVRALGQELLVRRAADTEIADTLTWLFTIVEHEAEPPKPSHLGSCGPESACDGDCSDAYYFAKNITEARALVKRLKPDFKDAGERAKDAEAFAAELDAAQQTSEMPRGETSRNSPGATGASSSVARTSPADRGSEESASFGTWLNDKSWACHCLGPAVINDIRALRCGFCKVRRPALDGRVVPPLACAHCHAAEPLDDVDGRCLDIRACCMRYLDRRGAELLAAQPPTKKPERARAEKAEAEAKHQHERATEAIGRAERAEDTVDLRTNQREAWRTRAEELEELLKAACRDLGFGEDVGAFCRHVGLAEPKRPEDHE